MGEPDLPHTRRGIPALPFCKSELKAPKPLPHNYPQTLITLVDHLRKKRLDLKLLQKDVARILGADTLSIVNWEKNHASPSLPFLPRIIEFLGYVPLSILPECIGERISVSRKLLGLSQQELARRLGIDPSTLAKWEKGKAQPSKASRSLNVLKKPEKGLLIVTRQSFFWGRYLPQQA